MIIWLNGAFGAGKTTTANALHRRIPGSYVFDPEHAGQYIRLSVPEVLKKGDFQDYPMWRSINVSMLRYLDQHHQGIILVPMTLVNPGYFEDIVGELRHSGIELHHYTLGASKEKLKARLDGRGEQAGSWTYQQIDRCVEALAHPRFAHYLDTDSLLTEEIIARIAALSKLSLEPNPDLR